MTLSQAKIRCGRNSACIGVLSNTDLTRNTPVYLGESRTLGDIDDIDTTPNEKIQQNPEYCYVTRDGSHTLRYIKERIKVITIRKGGFLNSKYMDDGEVLLENCEEPTWTSKPNLDTIDNCWNDGARWVYGSSRNSLDDAKKYCLWMPGCVGVYGSSNRPMFLGKQGHKGEFSDVGTKNINTSTSDQALFFRDGDATFHLLNGRSDGTTIETLSDNNC